MKRFIISLLATLCVCSCGDNSKDYSVNNPPNTIDLTSTHFSGCHNRNQGLWSCGQLAFNSSPEIGAYLVYLKDAFGVKTAIETGTFNGNTTVFLSHLFEQVHTVEYDEEMFATTSEMLKYRQNVSTHLGSSEQILKEILPTLTNEPILFYLDAHGNEFWPLLDELSEIAKSHRDNCIIVVDDFKVPGRPDLHYDKYGDQECSYEYVKEKLDEVFSNYTHLYLIPHNKHGHAKLVAMPNNLAATHTPKT